MIINKFIVLTAFLMAILSIASCGGSSGSDNDEIVVSGLWSGALTKTGDTCNPASPQTINFSHNVAQNESAVTLVTNSGATYLGNTVGGNGFSVDLSQDVTVNGATCPQLSRIEYDQIVDDDDPAAEVQFKISVDCAGTGDCETVYEGTASRAIATGAPTIPGGNQTPAPTAIPNQTGTPITQITGGCADINPNPANDSYEGDGACGISETVFRFEQQGSEGVVTLEAFGANGLTSFVVSPANTSTATSRRSDLTINNQPGYVCTMTCSPTATFTVRCTREGGDSCVEKF